MPGPVQKTFTIINKRGLHARASAKFVQLVSKYDAQLFVEKDGYKVGGTSIMGLMMLAASTGCQIKVKAYGAQAAQVMNALEQLINNRFDEEM